VPLLTDRHPSAERCFNLPNCRAAGKPAMTRLSASPSAENKLPTPIGKPHFRRRHAILTLRKERRAFRRSAMLGRNGFPNPRSLKSESPIRARPGGFPVTNPK
jgi:hypothetical protein